MTLPISFFRRRCFRLPGFNLAPLAFEVDPTAGEEELLLDRVISRSGDRPGVVAIAAPMPTPGQLRASIERHLRAAEAAPADEPPDARSELRDALAELRRSIG